MNNIDFLFINTNASKKIYQDLSKEYSAIETCHWAGMLASHCRMKGYSVDILDCEAENLTTEESAKRIKEYKATLNVFVVYRPTTVGIYPKHDWCS